MATTKKEDGVAIRVFRRKSGLNQQAFWATIGITQSGGSRYENGRRIPPPVRLLLRIAFGTASERDATVRRLLSRMPPK